MLVLHSYKIYRFTKLRLAINLCYVVYVSIIHVTCIMVHVGGVRYCPRCRLIKPDRCHHCSLCNRCVLKMDHHCPWYPPCLSLCPLHLSFTGSTIVLDIQITSFFFYSYSTQWHYACTLASVPFMMWFVHGCENIFMH